MATIDLDDIASALRREPVYVEPGAERALPDADAARLREAIIQAGTPVYVAVLPASASDAFGGDPAAVASELAEKVGLDGTYAVVVGDSLRAGSSVLPPGRAADLAVESLASGGDDTTAVLLNFVDRVADEAPPNATSAAVVANDPELELLLLSIDDLPTGWSVAPRGLFDADDGEDSCTDIVGPELPGVAGLPRASVGFLSDSVADVVGEMILQADSDEAARAIVAEVAAAFEACPVSVDDDGRSVSYEEMSFTDLGDVTVAYRAVPLDSSPPSSVALVAVAVDDRVILLAGGGTGGDFALFEQLAVTAVEKAG
jgi:hypothetical protein